MKRSVTWIVAAAIGLVAALAIADTVRNDPKSTPAAATAPATTSRPKPPTLTETLRSEAIAGSVLYSDQDCILHSLLLPQMEDEVVRGDNGAGAFHLCRFGLKHGRIVDEGYRGVAGGASYRGGQIVAGRRVLLAQRDLRAAARQFPNLGGADVRTRIEVDGIARPHPPVLVVAMTLTTDFAPPQFLAGIYRSRALVGVATTSTGPYENLFTSRDHELVGAEDGAIFMPDGGSVDPPTTLPAGSTVAFSPDNRWSARVNGRSIFLIATPSNEETGRIVRLPVPARDLVWEPGGVDPGAIVRTG